MASHVPFLAVRPNEETEVKTRDFASSTGSTASTINSALKRSRGGSVKGAASKVVDKTKATAKKAEKDVKKTAHQASRFGLKVANWLRFPLVIILSLAFRLAAYTLVSEWAGLELASVSRELRQDWQVIAVFVWKVLELVGVWWAKYNGEPRTGDKTVVFTITNERATAIDLASLSLLSNLPYYFLLSTFYQLSALSIGTSLLIDITSLTLPFVLLQPHVRSSNDDLLTKASSKEIARDYQVLLLTSILSAAVFAGTLYISFATWLPTHMITHFDNLRTLSVAHDSTIYTLAALFIPAGFAAMNFLFLPTVGASNTLLNALDPVTKDEPFNAETATLAQTVAYNLGISKEGLRPKTEVLAKRTVALALGSAINTFVRVYGTIEGAEVSGALGWAGLWAGAVTAVGAVYNWVAE